MSVADLTNTTALFTRLPLPALPRSVALASGFAFVADDLSDLQVVAIVPLDTADNPPTASIAATPADGDPGSPGIQVLEGHSFAVTTRVADDVQVRSVELLVDGQVVDADVAAPWSFFVTPPRVSTRVDVLTVQVRATDTGGNVALSNLLTFAVLADSAPPVLLDTTPDPGQRIAHVPAIELTFDEGLDPARLDPSGFSLVNLGADQVAGTADDTAVAVASLSLHDAGRILTIVPAGELAPGLYLLTVAPAVLADAAGNQVAAPVELSFTVPRVNAIQAASGSPADPELAVRESRAGDQPRGAVGARGSPDHVSGHLRRRHSIDDDDPAIPDRSRRRTPRGSWCPMRPRPAMSPSPATRTSDISDLPNWSITRGSVDLVSTSALYTGDGLFLDLAGTGATTGRIESKSLFDLAPGDYKLSFRLAGPPGQVNDPSNGVTVSLGGLFSEFFHRNYPRSVRDGHEDDHGDVADRARLVFDQSQGGSRAASCSTTSC